MTDIPALLLGAPLAVLASIVVVRAGLLLWADIPQIMLRRLRATRELREERRRGHDQPPIVPLS